jgi:hypothetical protein
MDPDSNLREMLELARAGVEAAVIDAVDADRLCELVLALDGWIVKGGFLPKRWQR